MNVVYWSLKKQKSQYNEAEIFFSRNGTKTIEKIYKNWIIHNLKPSTKKKQNINCRPKLKHKTIELEDKVGEHLDNLGYNNDFLYIILKTQSMK